MLYVVHGYPNLRAEYLSLADGTKCGIGPRTQALRSDRTGLELQFTSWVALIGYVTSSHTENGNDLARMF